MSVVNKSKQKQINLNEEYALTADSMNISEKLVIGVNLVEFKPTSFTDRFIVSYDGRIYDLHTKKYRKVSLVSEEAKNEYPVVSLTIDRKARRFLVHRLVADAWIDNPEQLPIVNHIDRNVNNFCADNLEWVTQKQNILHSRKILGNWNNLRNKGRFGILNKQSKPLKAVDNSSGEVLYFYGCQDAERKSNKEFNRTCVSKSCRGLKKNYRGYTWSYLSKSELEHIDESLFK